MLDLHANHDKLYYVYVLFRYGKNSSIPTLGQGKWKDEHVDYSVIDEASNGIQTEYATSQ